MGGELLDSSPPPLDFLTKTFNEQFPFYLSIGMTAEQYWDDDCTLVKHYRKAYELQNRRKNQELWLQGMYIYEALCNASPLLNPFSKEKKPLPYPDRPYPLTKEDAIKEEKERKAIKMRQMKAQFEAWAANLDLPTEHQREEQSAD